ncbi:unnamed protein product [Coregonus sp. 'balchen']|nr:unnamed protein product [Coregonus sp. 'balchen']
MALRLEVPSLRLLWAREAAGHPVPSTLSPSTPAPCTLQPSPRVQFDRPPLHRQGPAQTPSVHWFRDLHAWAIKQEGLRRAGQWKQSKVENPEWNKLTYIRKPLASTAQRLKAERGASRESEKSNRAEIHSLEFQQFLESDGKVTKQRQLLHLEQDVSQIRHYCTLRHQHDMVLEVRGDIQEGSLLTVAHCCVFYEEQSQESTQKEDSTDHDRAHLNRLIRDSLSRAHQKIKMCPTFIYPWQGNHEEDEIQNVVENSCSNTDQPAKNRLQQRGRGITQAHRQQFEFSKGQIVNCRNRCLAVGVAGHGEGGVKAGSPLQLVRSNPSYSNQRWTLNEGERTLHLLANPELVLSVSMTTTPPGDSCSEPPLLTGCSVVLQKYKPYSYGAANQKWGWLPELRVLSAFYTSSLDQEVTAANQASVCTACVSPEPLHQQKLPPESSFLCCMASHNHQLSPTGPFRILKVHKRLEECLESLRTEAAVLQKQTPSPEVCSAARTQPSVKILAHRNGRGGLEEGQLITTATMPLTVFKVGAEDMSSVDEGLMALILRSPIHVWVSCGEPYLPSDERAQPPWCQACGPARPVVVEQSWLQPSHEELTLDQELHNTATQLAEMEALPEKDHRPLPQKTSQELYHQPDVKRVKVYHNGDRHVSVHVWGQSIEELLSCSTVRLALSRSASRLYAADGRLLSSWEEIHRDMLLCVSSGQPFISPKR